MQSVRWRLWIPCLLMTSLLAVNATAAEDEPTIASFRLRGSITEAPPPEFAFFGLDKEKATSLNSILERIDKARKDPNVSGILLTLEDPSMGWAQMQELREALLAVRAADKDVYCHIEEVSDNMYMLASAATRLAIVPTGGIGLLGIHMESMYIKNLLDKIKVEADFEHIGDYKGAAEPLTRDSPSPAAIEQMNWLADDLYAQTVDAVSQARGLDPQRVRELIDQGVFTAGQALDAGLVDAVEYRQDFIEQIRDKHGEAAKIVANYGRKVGPEIDFSSPFSFFEALGQMMQGEKAADKPVIAVVYVDGMIVDGRSEDSVFGTHTAGSTTLRRVFDKVRKDDNIKAVVMRIDSPGGSALASEIIWNAAKRCADDKPLIVSMGNVTASGGYYIATAAKTIYADPGTITGSIGVLGGKLVTKGLWNWIGVTNYATQRGHNADLYSSDHRWTEDQRALVRGLLEEVYAVFTNHVVDSRGDRLTESIDKLAGGRVYTGKLAKAKGLVDELGGLQAAIAKAAKQAELTDYEIRVLPRPKTLRDLFREGLGLDEDEDDTKASIASSRWPTLTTAWRIAGETLQQLDRPHGRAVVRLLQRLDLLGRDGVSLVLPNEFLINGMGW